MTLTTQAPRQGYLSMHDGKNRDHRLREQRSMKQKVIPLAEITSAPQDRECKPDEAVLPFERDSETFLHPRQALDNKTGIFDNVRAGNPTGN